MENKDWTFIIIMLAVVCLLLAFVFYAEEIERKEKLTDELIKTKHGHSVQQEIKRRLEDEAIIRFKMVIVGIIGLYLCFNTIAYFLCINHNSILYGLPMLIRDNKTLILTISQLIPLTMGYNWIKFQVRKYTFRGFEHLEIELQDKVGQITRLELEIANR